MHPVGCDCLVMDPAYMRDYRRNNPTAYDRHRRAHKAYRRALLELRDAHPEEFGRILTLERAALGLPPVGAVKPGRKPKDKDAA